MTDALATALATPGLWWVALAALLAGLARGFSGFGSGLIFVPMAGMVLPPVWVVVVIVVIDLIGTVPTLPRTMRDAGLRDVGLMVIGMVAGLPFGLWVLTSLPTEVFRWGASLLALAMLALMLTGWRYRGPRGPRVRLAVGALAGVLGGATSLPGPPAIVFEMSADQAVARTRANLMTFLVAVDFALLALLLLRGDAVPQALVIGGLLILPFSLASMVGARLFDPARATLYRRAAYAMIAASALMGLPIGA